MLDQSNSVKKSLKSGEGIIMKRLSLKPDDIWWRSDQDVTSLCLINRTHWLDSGISWMKSKPSMLKCTRRCRYKSLTDAKESCYFHADSLWKWCPNTPKTQARVLCHHSNMALTHTAQWFLFRQASDDEMKKKNNMISRLEEKTNQITATMKQLEQRWELLPVQTRLTASAVTFQHISMMTIKYGFVLKVRRIHINSTIQCFFFFVKQTEQIEVRMLAWQVEKILSGMKEIGL